MTVGERRVHEREDGKRRGCHGPRGGRGFTGATELTSDSSTQQITQAPDTADWTQTGPPDTADLFTETESYNGLIHRVRQTEPPTTEYNRLSHRVQYNQVQHIGAPSRAIKYKHRAIGYSTPGHRVQHTGPSGTAHRATEYSTPGHRVQHTGPLGTAHWATR